MNDDFGHIGVGSVSLYVNRNANIWSRAAMHLSRTVRLMDENYVDPIPLQIVVVYIVPGYRNPVEFSGTRITIKSRKGPKRVQVEAAVPDMLFPENNQEDAKKIILDLMLKSVEQGEVYANKNKIIKGELTGARSVVQKLWKGWNLSDFSYGIPHDLPYFDLPKVNGLVTRRFVEQLPNGGVQHYNMVIDENGQEVI